MFKSSYYMHLKSMVWAAGELAGDIAGSDELDREDIGLIGLRLPDQRLVWVPRLRGLVVLGPLLAEDDLPPPGDRRHDGLQCSGSSGSDDPRVMKQGVKPSSTIQCA